MKEEDDLNKRKTGRRKHNGIAEIMILIALPVVFNYLVPVMVVVSPPYTYAGAAVMLSGFGLMIWAAIEFLNSGTGFQLKEGGSTMVTSGPFQFSRNPMYLGMLIWLFGFAVLLGSLSVFFFPVVFFLLAHFLLIPVEERKMEQIYKEQYTKYRKHVRRWLL